MRISKNIMMVVLGLSASASLTSAVLAQDVPEFGVADISCRELLTMGGEEQDATLIFMNGYVSGKRNADTINPSALMAASDKALANCIDTPEAPMITVLEAARTD